MQVASSDDVGVALVSDGFGRGFEAQFSSYLVCRKEVPPQNLPRVSRGETLQFSESKGRCRRVTFAPPASFGVSFPYVSHGKTINDGMMADVIDRTFFYVIFMVSMCDRRWTVSTYPVLHMCMCS